MNQYEAGIVRRVLNDAGYEETRDESSADLLLMLTCSVRSRAEARAIGRLAGFRALRRSRPGTLVGVLGCTARNLGRELIEGHGADLVVGPDRYLELPALVAAARAEGPQLDIAEGGTCYEDIRPVPDRPFCGMVTVMRGCDNHCSYCIVPLVRGRERSKSLASVLAETDALVEQGIRDITLLGQNVLAWRENGLAFPDLFERVAARPGVDRLRFLTSHPRDLDRRFLQTIARLPNACPALHLPVQSGSDRILGMMNRGYTRAEYLDKVALARELVPGLTMTTDVMVGFPSETDEDFEDTLELVTRVRFDFAYMFRYSQRPGTPAEGLGPKVSEAVAGARLARLIEAQNRVTGELHRELVGRTVELLIESPGPRGRGMLGRTPDNRTVIVHAPLEPGELVNCRVTRVQGWTPIAEPAGEPAAVR